MSCCTRSGTVAKRIEVIAYGLTQAGSADIGSGLHKYRERPLALSFILRPL